MGNERFTSQSFAKSQSARILLRCTVFLLVLSSHSVMSKSACTLKQGVTSCTRHLHCVCDTAGCVVHGDSVTGVYGCDSVTAKPPGECKCMTRAKYWQLLEEGTESIVKQGIFDHTVWAEEVLRGADADQDSHVTAEELHAMEEKATSVKGMKKFVEGHDSDGDGKLSLSELAISVKDMVHESQTTTTTSPLPRRPKEGMRFRKNRETGQMEAVDSRAETVEVIPDFMKGAPPKPKTTTPFPSDADTAKRKKYRKNDQGIMEHVPDDEL